MKRILGIAFLILAFSHGFAQNPTSQLAYEYYNARDFEKAAPLFLKMYEENNSPSFLRYYVSCLIETREYDEAVKAVRKAIRQTKDVTLNVQLGDLYEFMGESKKADEALQEPMKNFPANEAAIINLGNTYSSYAKFQYAQMVFETGRKVLGKPNAFRLELASIFYSQRRFPEMLDEYYNLLLTDQKYVPTVQAMIQNALNNDIDQNLMQLTRDKTYAFIQQYPDNPSYYDMLVWVLVQEKKFSEAADEAIAMDRRNQAAPEKVLMIARLADDGGDLSAALKAYQYVISRGPSGQGRQSVYTLARVEYLMARSDQMKNLSSTNATAWSGLADEFNQGIQDLARENAADPLYTELADIEAFRLVQYDQAVAILDNAIAMPGKSPLFRTQCLLKKGDILLGSGDPWGATLVYSMVDLENPDNPQGSEARYKKALLSWYTGNYKWALAQLDVIKGGTSNLNANDAMELSILIRENISETDSAQTSLMKLSAVDYLIFRHRNDEALAAIDSMIRDFPKDAVVDDCLYKKAHLLLDRNEIRQSMAVLDTLAENFRYEYWGHKAVYELACLYQDRLRDDEKAIGLFEGFLRDFPSSFYFIDARNRLKALKSKSKG